MTPERKIDSKLPNFRSGSHYGSILGLLGFCILFRSWGHFESILSKGSLWVILGLLVTLGPFWVSGSLLVHSGSGGSLSVHFGFWGHFGSIFGIWFTLGPFWVWGSLFVHFGFVGHFGSILGLGITFGPFWV